MSAPCVVESFETSVYQPWTLRPEFLSRGGGKNLCFHEAWRFRHSRTRRAVPGECSDGQSGSSRPGKYSMRRKSRALNHAWAEDVDMIDGSENVPVRIRPGALAYMLRMATSRFRIQFSLL